MNRRSLLRLASGTAAAAAIAVPFPVRAQLFGASLVYDPSNYAAMLKSLSNEFIQNKNELMLVNMALNQWQALQFEHHLNIGQMWNDVAPLINQFEKQLVVNDKISQSTGNIYTAVTQAFPTFNPNTPVPYLLAVYRKYMQQSAANVIAANQLQQQNSANRTTQLASIQSRAAQQQSEEDKYQSTIEMSAFTAQGIDLLHSTIQGFVGLYARYIEDKAAQEQASTESGRLLVAQQLLGSAQGTLKQNPPAYTMSQYASNPTLMPTLPK